MNDRGAAELAAYHDATKHSVESVRRSRHALDWDIMPRPFKVYPALPGRPLPSDLVSGTRLALPSLADPGTGPGDGPRLDQGTIARLLHFSAGVLRRRAYPGGEIFFRAAACTGALYHIDVYLVSGALPDLAAGVYHFGPHDRALRQLRAGDHRAAVVAATGNEPALAEASVILAFTSTFWRNAWKYQARTYRHCFWDSGTILANLLALAAGVSVPARVVLGFDDEVLNRLLDLDTSREVTLGLVALGRGAEPAPPAPSFDRLHLETLPPSAREVEYPAIGRAHAASSLASASEAGAWRAAALAPGAPSSGEPLIALPTATPEVQEPIERVIHRRGSSRAFAREPIVLEELAAIVRNATRGVPSDFVLPGAHLSDLYLLAHAVDGVAPGAYVYDRDADGLRLLRAGEFRLEAGHLGLGQMLPADASVALYWLTDLGPILTRLGGRGYRAAQLEAAIEGGKAYLAVYALGLGATGLTFFDDDVTRFLSPHAAGKSVMFHLAVGHRT